MSEDITENSNQKKKKNSKRDNMVEIEYMGNNYNWTRRVHLYQ